MNKFVLPDLWYNVFLSLYCLDAIFAIVLAIGWLTCANYYYKFDSAFIAIFLTFSLIISGLLGISLFVPDKSFNEGLLVTHGLVIFAILIIWVGGNIYYGILSLRQYFKTKRGR
jgi:hypothetical protein